MGAHLLTLSELCTALLHLASEQCITQLAQTYLGRSLARSVRILADEVHAMLGPEERAPAVIDDDDIGDLSGYPGYAVIGAEHHTDRRDTGIMLWSQTDPYSAPPLIPVAVIAEPDESPARAELKAQAVGLINDLRQGLRIEARYRALPADLDARLFAPLDAAIRRRRDRIERSNLQTRRASGADDPRVGGIRREVPSVGAGPVGC